nr:MAG TPA_asm: hypothetical protein [Caudoviricetes sp.]
MYCFVLKKSLSLLCNQKGIGLHPEPRKCLIFNV